MNEGVQWLDILDISIFSLGWMKHACLDELLLPGDLFFIFNPHQKLSKSILFLLGFDIGYNVDDHEWFLWQFSSWWSNIGKLNGEALISYLNILLDNWHLNGLLGFTSLEYKDSMNRLKIYPSSSSVFSIIKLMSSIFYSNLTIRTILSVNNNFSKFVRSKSLNSLGFFEKNLSWLVVINNCDSSLCIFTFKFGTFSVTFIANIILTFSTFKSWILVLLTYLTCYFIWGLSLF